MTYKIKNWSKFQHFKDRKPPWVKLYRDLLDDIEWFELSPVYAKNLINIWLIASEYNGELPDNKTLAFRLRVKNQELTAILRQRQRQRQKKLYVRNSRFRPVLTKRSSTSIILYCLSCQG